MSGDPVEESGQAVRQGFLQALQTAHTTNALLRSRGGDSRSAAESDQRLDLAAAKDERSSVEHHARLHGLGVDRDLSITKIEEVRDRIANNQKVTEVEVRLKEGQIARADADLVRRDEAGALERDHNTEIHRHKIDGYVNREIRAVELHELDVEYKQLLIDIRRRAAGFTETLHHTDGDTGRGMAAAAQFAAADATADLSPHTQAAAEAYRERFTADTGRNPEDMFDAGERASVGDSWSHAFDDIAGLAEDLTMAAHLHHEFGVSINGLDPPSAGAVIGAEMLDTGERIESAVSATAVRDSDPGEPDPGIVVGGSEHAETAPGKEIELRTGIGGDT